MNTQSKSFDMHTGVHDTEAYVCVHAHTDKINIKIAAFRISVSIYSRWKVQVIKLDGYASSVTAIGAETEIGMSSSNTGLVSCVHFQMNTLWSIYPAMG